MKVGPDGRIYFGTLSEKKRGISNKVDGKFYSIDTEGNVRELLCGINVSNGMAWSMDEKRFYYTDSDTKIIKEYAFDKVSGDITYTGREVHVPGVDGFTIDDNDRLFVGCWGMGRVTVVDTKKMEILYHIDVPARIPTSCSFAGEDMDELVVVSATYGIPEDNWINDGMTFICKPGAKGKAPYIFDSEKVR
jgi:sugar lactone lactonase YvrE